MFVAPGNRWVGPAWETGVTACSLALRVSSDEEGAFYGYKVRASFRMSQTNGQRGKL